MSPAIMKETSQREADPPRASARITVSLTRRAVKELDRLARSEGLSKTDIVNRAINMMYEITQELKSGGELAYVHTKPDGSQQIRKVFRFIG